MNRFRYLIIILLLLVFQIVSVYANDVEYCWVKVENVNALLEFDARFTELNQFVWHGNTVTDGKKGTVIDGAGHLILKDKKTGYRTGCIPCKFKKGILISAFQVPSTSYKCLNDSCTKIETILNKGTIYRGRVTFDDNKLNIISYDEGIISQKEQYFIKVNLRLIMIIYFLMEIVLFVMENHKIIVIFSNLQNITKPHFHYVTKMDIGRILSLSVDM